MLLGDLRVVHLAKKGTSELPADAAKFGPAYFLDSCQRWLWIGRTQELPEALPAPFEVRGGEGAYLFLLRVASGLESEIQGETDIFGQLKDACRENGIPEVDFWMQKLFEDTKEIRAQYLQGLGGSSYGSLVRKLLPESGPVLLVGAGQIARGIAPYLRDRELYLANRSPERLMDLRAEIATKPGQAVHCIDEAAAFEKVSALVVCTPFGTPSDPARIERARERGIAVIHLGGYREKAGDWAGIPGFKALDEIFQLQQAQNELRANQLQQAGKACETRAKLRALAASLSISHGWEDLAAFG